MMGHFISNDLASIAFPGVYSIPGLHFILCLSFSDVVAQYTVLRIFDVFPEEGIDKRVIFIDSTLHLIKLNSRSVFNITHANIFQAEPPDTYIICIYHENLISALTVYHGIVDTYDTEGFVNFYEAFQKKALMDEKR